MPEYTDIECATPESAHALHAYLLVELGQEEDAPRITATVEGSTLRVTYGSYGVRELWDARLLGYQDGRDSLEPLLRELRHHLQRQPDIARLIDGVLGIRSQ